MANLDGGHYFLTTLIPLKREPEQRADGTWTSPSHLLRETLATLPTAQQSPACVAAGFESPFSRCTRTHFARFVVIDQPMYNGRDADNSIVQGLRNVNLLAHQPVDNLKVPYLMFAADFDARPNEEDGGFASWAMGLWDKLDAELRVIFAACLAFDGVRDRTAFASWLARCQVETTMPFNDYYVPMPDLHGYTQELLKGVVIGGTLLGSVLAVAALKALDASLWWLLAAVPLAAVLALATVLLMLWVKGRKPFPAGVDTDLPSVLKGLFVQQRFALLAAELQGADAATVHARFGEFVDRIRPDDREAPTQKPGVIRSDNIPLVDHRVVTPKRVAL